MKKKKILKNTMNSLVYKKALSFSFGCPICPPNKGCNRRPVEDKTTWKNNRDSQWRE